MGQTIFRWVGGWLIGLLIGFSLILALTNQLARQILLFDALAVVVFIIIMRRMRGG